MVLCWSTYFHQRRKSIASVLHDLVHEGSAFFISGETTITFFGIADKYHNEQVMFGNMERTAKKMGEELVFYNRHEASTLLSKDYVWRPIAEMVQSGEQVD